MQSRELNLFTLLCICLHSAHFSLAISKQEQQILLTSVRRKHAWPRYPPMAQTLQWTRCLRTGARCCSLPYSWPLWLWETPSSAPALTGQLPAPHHWWKCFAINIFWWLHPLGRCQELLFLEQRNMLALQAPCTAQLPSCFPPSHPGKCILPVTAREEKKLAPLLK